MNANFKLDELTADHPCLDLVTGWVHDEWGRDIPQSFSETRHDLLVQPGSPPTLVAMQNDKAVGLVAFRRYPVPEIQDTGLWLNILYVEEGHRGQGIGSTLIRIAEERAAQLVSKLFVYTPVPALYEKLGWLPFREANEKGSSVLTRMIGEKAD